MLTKLEKKILQVKSVRIAGLKYEFKRVTPGDFLDKEGVPLCKWQIELGKELSGHRDGSDAMTIDRLKKHWTKLFKKAIISIQDNDDNLDNLIDALVENYYVANELYAEIAKHCLNLKKKLNLFSLFQKQSALI